MPTPATHDAPRRSHGGPSRRPEGGDFAEAGDLPKDRQVGSFAEGEETLPHDDHVGSFAETDEDPG